MDHDMNMESDSSDSSRSTTPIEDTNNLEICETLQALQRRIRKLVHYRDEMLLLINSNRRRPDHDDTDEQFQNYLLLHSKAQADLSSAEGEYATIPYCTVPGCPVHSTLPTTPNKSQPTKRKDEDGFVTPPTRKTAKRQIISESSTIINSNNKFNNLTIQETSNTQSDEVVTKPKERLPPPIMLKINNYKQQLKAIHYVIPDLRTKLSGEYIKLYVDTPEEYRKLISYLSTRAEYEYYVIRPALQRPVKAIFKGLPRETLPEDINEELQELGFNPIRVVQLTNRRTKIPLPIFLATIPRTPEAEKIYEITKICYMNVIVEGYRGSGKITQCYRCNHFHHSAENCHIKPRCLKCAEAHLTRDCQIKERIQNPECINCEQQGHLASYGGCEKYPKPPKKQLQNQKQNFIKKNVSYANAVNNTQQMAPQQPQLNTSNRSNTNNSKPSRSNPNNRNKAINLVNQHLQHQNPPQTQEEDTENDENTPDLFQAIEMLQSLAEIFKQLPGLLKNLPKIKAARGKTNKTYALIEALMDGDNNDQ